MRINWVSVTSPI